MFQQKNKHLAFCLKNNGNNKINNKKYNNKVNKIYLSIRNNNLHNRPKIKIKSHQF